MIGPLDHIATAVALEEYIKDNAALREELDAEVATVMVLLAENSKLRRVAEAAREYWESTHFGTGPDLDNALKALGEGEK